MSSQFSTTAEYFSHIRQLIALKPDLDATQLAVIALGANLPSELGEPADTLRAVLPVLQRLSTTPLVVSPIIETEPDDCPPGSPRFANAVVLLTHGDGVSPEQLLIALQKIEVEFGRQRKGVRNEARPLDLDIISAEALRYQSPTLILPHPRARQRLFVMEPLAAIWPEFRFPGNLSTAAQIVQTLISPS